jgi:hypothetical protein
VIIETIRFNIETSISILSSIYNREPIRLLDINERNLASFTIAIHYYPHGIHSISWNSLGGSPDCAAANVRALMAE